MFYSVQLRFKIWVYIFVGVFSGWYVKIFCGGIGDAVFLEVFYKVLNAFPCYKIESMNCKWVRIEDGTALQVRMGLQWEILKHTAGVIPV